MITVSIFLVKKKESIIHPYQSFGASSNPSPYQKSKILYHPTEIFCYSQKKRVEMKKNLALTPPNPLFIFNFVQDDNDN
ncbi:hypothetical protein SNEBB_009657 [Seison nebaliae]|nr:hypothetical protein SNEBB_009657 [Seison nebaliae]